MTELEHLREEIDNLRRQLATCKDKIKRYTKEAQHYRELWDEESVKRSWNTDMGR
jgi:uncharacterized coiled-coil DUF342 family protein